MLKKEGEKLSALKPTDILALVNTVQYHRNWNSLDFAAQESLVWQVLSEAVAKLHHKLIYDINKRKYRIAEPLVQAQPGQAGDFISHYDLRLAFETEAEKSKFERNHPSPKLPDQLELAVGGSRHVYAPLYRDSKDRGVAKLKLKTISISPDALNPGERKFVEDLHGFLGDPARKGAFKDYTFYLMRNVESLRSIGVYLDTESRAYFPDFVLWAVGSKQTHILLIDPKGQSGIMDWGSLTTGYNAKVALSGSSDLAELGLKLTAATEKPCKVSSFILLRKSSPLGRANGITYDLKTVSDMEVRGVLHLDWAPEIHRKRVDEDGDSLPPPPDGRSYLDRMFKIALGVGHS